MSLVVVVSDIPGNLHVYEDALRQLGGTAVSTFASPVTLAQRAPDLDVDVMVVDVLMKEAHELDFIERLRRRTVHSDFAVVLVTDPADNDLRIQALRMGIDDILKRPADSLILADRVRRLLKLAVRHRKLADKASALDARHSPARARDDSPLDARSTASCQGKPQSRRAHGPLRSAAGEGGRHGIAHAGADLPRRADV